MYDVIIVGSGPAGLSAAIYALRAQLSTIVIEQEPMNGGQVVNTYEVDNYPGMPKVAGVELSMKFREHCDQLGTKFVTGKVTEMVVEEDKKIVVVDTNERYETRSVIIATGATNRRLGVDGEKRLAGQGVSYCATCDGAFFKNKDVVVVGGGDVAIEDAIFLARLCRKVYIVHRRDEFRATKTLSSYLEELDNIEILWNTTVEEIIGAHHVQSVKLHNKLTDERNELFVSGVFVAVGMIPNTSVAKGLVKMDDDGYIIAGEDGVTSLPGVFVAGDARTKELRQIITAAADGANAVQSIEKYFMKKKQLLI